uniref:Uncharacterized protein n=1 Tax=Leersia perrieri TaxID=77586 RepID=A0A0D9XZN5_9ORYZ
MAGLTTTLTVVARHRRPGSARQQESTKVWPLLLESGRTKVLFGGTAKAGHLLQVSGKTEVSFECSAEARPVLQGLWQFDLEKLRKELNDTSRNTGKLKMVMRQVDEKLNANKELQKDIEEKLAANAESKLEGDHEDQIKLSIRLNELNESIEEYCSMMVVLMSILVSCVTSLVLGFAIIIYGFFVHVQSNNELKVKELMESTNEKKESLAATEDEVRRLKIMLDTKLMAIGNIVHESVPISDNEENNVVLRTWGERRMKRNLKNHVDLCRKLDIVAFEQGVDVAGGRDYFLKGYGVLLNQALINFGLAFLQNRGFNLLHTHLSHVKGNNE